MNYTIQEVTTEEHEAIFVNLLEEGGLYPSGSGILRFNWFYRNASSKAYILYTEHGVPIGTKGYGLRNFWRNNKKYIGAISVDISVIKEYRQLAPAYFLHRETTQNMLDTVDFVYGIPNRHSTVLYKRSRLLEPLTHFNRFAKILNVSQVLKDKFVCMHGALNKMWNATNILRQVNLRSQTSNVPIEDLKLHNSMWNQFSSPELQGSRNYDYLMWRYLRNPLTKYSTFSCNNGIVVYLQNEHRVYIVDIICDLQMIKHTLAAFEQHCKSKDVGVIILCMIGAEKTISAIKSIWYKQVDPHPTKMLWIGSKNSTLRNLFQQHNISWFLGDEDAN